MRIIRIIPLIISAFLSANIYAQDPQFSQFYSNPVYLNPALAGIKPCPQVNLNYRNQWPQLSAAFETFSGSFDLAMKSLNSGIGGIIVHDQAGKGTLKTTMFYGIYSYNLQVKRKFAIRFGAQAGVFNKSLDWQKLVFGDQIDPRRGVVYETTDTKSGEDIWAADFGVGMVGYGKKWYAGFALNHINRPNESLLAGTSRMPIRLTIHGGARFVLKKKTKDGKGGTEISPNIIIQQQGSHQEINFGFYYTKGVIVLGTWLRTSMRNPDAMIFLLGLHTKVVKFGYSYDLTISRLTATTGGAHEISLGFNIPCAKKRRKFRALTCPSF